MFWGENSCGAGQACSESLCGDTTKLKAFDLFGTQVRDLEVVRFDRLSHHFRISSPLTSRRWNAD